MARVELTVQDIVNTGLSETLIPADDTDNHVFDNDGRVFLRVVNGETDVTVTIKPGLVRSGLSLEDLTVLVPADESRVIGPFVVADFNQPGTTKVHVDIDDDTNVTIGAFRLP